MSNIQKQHKISPAIAWLTIQKFIIFYCPLDGEHTISQGLFFMTYLSFSIYFLINVFPHFCVYTIPCKFIWIIVMDLSFLSSVIHSLCKVLLPLVITKEQPAYLPMYSFQVPDPISSMRYLIPDYPR